jgi:hypothetical protein
MPDPIPELPVNEIACARRQPVDMDVTETLPDETHSSAPCEPLESKTFECSNEIETLDPVDRKYEDPLTFRFENVKLTSELVMRIAFVALDPLMISGRLEIEPLKSPQINISDSMVTFPSEILQLTGSGSVRDWLCIE